jgi:hypothetical protein
MTVAPGRPVRLAGLCHDAPVLHHRAVPADPMKAKVFVAPYGGLELFMA